MEISSSESDYLINEYDDFMPLEVDTDEHQEMMEAKEYII